MLGFSVSQIRPLAVYPFFQLCLDCSVHFLQAKLCFFQVSLKHYLFWNLSLFTLQITFPVCSWISLSSYVHPSGAKLSQSELSYTHCAMTVSSRGVWPLHRQDWCLHQTELTTSNCIELVQVPKNALREGAGILFSFLMDAIGKLEDLSFLGYLTDSVILWKLLIAKVQFNHV